MQNLYIDESGSMTIEHAESLPYFVIALVRCDNPVKLKTLYRRFVKKHMAALQAADKERRMFLNGRLHELKGSSFTPPLKREFVSYFAREGTLEVYYIVLDNKKIAEHCVKNSKNLYANTARAFNYVLKLAMEYFVKSGYLPDDAYHIQLDERNERPESRFFLEDYLNTEFQMEKVLSNDVTVAYFDSSNNKIVQLADVFANLYYSQLMTDAYTDEIGAMRANGCLKYIFKFPLR